MMGSTDSLSISNSAIKTLIILSCCYHLQALGSTNVKSEKKLLAAVGRNVTLLCQLMTTKENIIQITWQKESGNFTGPVASNSRVYGQKILGGYSKRAKHSSVDAFNMSAIIISPVIQEDEGCFKCIFNLFPVGASSGTICLNVYEEKISEPTLDLEVIDIPETLEKFLVITCTGSGRPAPHISWNHSLDLQHKPQTFSIVNPDGTVTVISNMTYPMNERIEGTEVTCIVNHPALGAEKRLSKLVPYTAEDTSTKWQHIQILVIPLLVFFMMSPLLIILHLHLQKKSKFQNGPHNHSKNLNMDGLQTPIGSEKYMREISTPGNPSANIHLLSSHHLQ